MILQSEDNIVIGDHTGTEVLAGAAQTALLGSMGGAGGPSTLGVNTSNAVSTVDVTSREGAPSRLVTSTVDTALLVFTPKVLGPPAPPILPKSAV